MEREKKTMKYDGYNVIEYNEHYNITDETIRKGKMCYVADFITLDTETSHTNLVTNEKGVLDNDNTFTWVYQWCACFNNTLVNGRKPSELVTFYNRLVCDLCINKNKRLVTYIHNASYDFSYLFPYFNRAFGKCDVIAIDNRHIISVQYENGLVFRCSYKLSNKSLNVWSNDLDTKHKKLVGFVDYNALHYQDSELTLQDYEYMYHDVIVQRECILEEMRQTNHTIANIPLTSTGFIREMTYKSFKSECNETHNAPRKEFQNTRLDVDTYHLCKLEISGGITHGNRFLANETITSTKSHYLKHRDYDSDYPTQQICKQYPIGKFNLFYTENQGVQPSISEVIQLTKDNCLLMKVAIKNLCLKSNKITLPYAQTSHFKKVTDDNFKKSIIEDNGRVLKYEGISIVSLNEIDLKWLIKQYNFKIKFLEIHTSKKGYLPSWLTNVIKELYKQKTDLKQEIKEMKKTGKNVFEKEQELLRTKALLNSVFGMTCSDPIRDNYKVDINGLWSKDNNHDTNCTGEMLDNYYKGKKNCMRFQWGCWCTAHARDELMTDYERITTGFYGKCEKGTFVYSDTDSIFYISNDSLEKCMEYQNTIREETSIINGWYVTLSNGKLKPFNHFDDEKDDVYKFKFLHAKAYCIVHSDNTLDCTVAGVPKRIYEKDGYFYREQELKTIDNFKNEFTFTKCGGTTCRYINQPIHKVEVNNHIIETCGGGIICNTTKTLSEMDVNII